MIQLVEKEEATIRTKDVKGLRILKFLSTANLWKFTGKSYFKGLHVLKFLSTSNLWKFTGKGYVPFCTIEDEHPLIHGDVLGKCVDLNIQTGGPNNTKNARTTQKAFPSIRMLWANWECKDTPHENWGKQHQYGLTHTVYNQYRPIMMRRFR